MFNRPKARPDDTEDDSDYKRLLHARELLLKMRTGDYQLVWSIWDAKIINVGGSTYLKRKTIPLISKWLKVLHTSFLGAFRGVMDL